MTCSVLTNCLIEKGQVRIKTPETYYISNNYTNVTKVYEELIEIRTGSKHKKRRRTKKLAIMQTHPHQAGVTHILKSSPACQNIYLFTRISASRKYQ